MLVSRSSGMLSYRQPGLQQKQGYHQLTVEPLTQPMCPLPGDGGEWCRQAQMAGPWGQTHLHWCITVVHQKGKADHWDQEELQPERVILHVKRFPELPIDHVHSDIGTEEENNLERHGHL